MKKRDCVLCPLVSEDTPEDWKVEGFGHVTEEFAPGVRWADPIDEDLPVCTACRDGHQVILAIYEVYRLSGMTIDDRLSPCLARGFARYRYLSQQDLLIDDLKWRIAAICSHILGQELPKMPSHVSEGPECYKRLTLLGGRFYAFTQKMRRARFSQKDFCSALSFAWSVNQSKKGFPRPAEERLQVGKAKFGETMSIPQDEDLDQSIVIEGKGMPERRISLRDLVVSCRKIVDSLHGRVKGRLIWDDYRRVVFPSIRAHFASGRGVLGALGSLCGTHQRPEWLAPFPPAVGMQKPLIRDEVGLATASARRTDVIRKSLVMMEDWRREVSFFGEYLDGTSSAKLRQREGSDVGRPFFSGLVPWLVPSLTDEKVTLAYEVMLGRRVLTDDWAMPHALFHIEGVAPWRRAAYEANLAAALHEENIVDACALAEACKVRTISRGPVYRYAFGHSLQKFLFSLVRDVPEIGSDRVITGCELERRLSPLEEGEVWISGDFKAATDNIHRSLSNAVVHHICDKFMLGPVERQLFLDSLTGHRIADPFWRADMDEVAWNSLLARAESGEELTETETRMAADVHEMRFLLDNDNWLPRLHEQRRGQLMGSPTSFIVLCIINLALAQVSLGVENIMGSRAVVVNGDDVLLRIPKDRTDHWERVCALGGLQSSVGKTFYSDEFCTINSTMFRYYNAPVAVYSQESQDFESDCRFHQLPFINLGLLFGYGRSTTMVSDSDRDGTLGARCADLLYGFSPSMKRKVFGSFMKYNRRYLPPAPIPWFLPESFGGVGLPLSLCDEVPTLDLRAAAGVQRRDVAPPKLSKPAEELDCIRNDCERDAEAVLGGKPPEALVGELAFFALQTGSWCHAGLLQKNEKRGSEEALRKKEAALRQERIKRAMKFWREACLPDRLGHVSTLDLSRPPGRGEQIDCTIVSDPCKKTDWLRSRHLDLLAVSDLVFEGHH